MMNELRDFHIQDLITKFFGIASEMVLVLQLTPAGVLVPYLEITQSKRKQTYFLKRKPQKVTEDNYKDLLIPGDMAPNPIEELAVLVEDVSSLTLSNYLFFNETFHYIRLVKI